MSGSEEETYSVMFSSLRHPARRKILLMLLERSMTFSQLLEELRMPSSRLTYHLENLGELIEKMEDGKYQLSSFGRASVAMMKRAEEVPNVQAKRFSSLPLRWKSLYAILTITIVLLASISHFQYASLNQLSKDYELLRADFEKVQAQNQQLLSWSTSADKAMAIIRNVIQIDVTKYKVTLLSNTVEDRADLGGVIEEVIKYSLVNIQSRIELTLRFRNNHFSLAQLDQLEGLPSYPLIYTQVQPLDNFEAARRLLERYKSVANDPYLDEILRLLASSNETNNEQVLGNTKLKVSIYGDYAGFQLLYTENDTDFSAKNIHLVFENHVLRKLSDDWFFYKIGSTQMNISKEQAIQIARNAVRGFKWNANGVQVSEFSLLDEPVSAVFVPHPRTEPSILVPYWYITLYLDKSYPGGVNSIAVGIWADTGRIANIQAIGSELAS